MSFNPNPLFYEMARIYSENKTEENKIFIGNEGGTRSSKTWDTFLFLYTFCDHNPNRNLEIYILRDTLDNCREKTFKDFQKCMLLSGVKNIAYKSEGMKPTAYIKGNEIRFRGLDKASKEGYPSDITFVNEALDTELTQLDGIFMRCRLLVILDWNPKFTDHWVFDLEKRDNAFFTHTTFRNNKHLQKSIINDILSSEPWEIGSYEVINGELIYNGELISDKNQPPEHKKNAKHGTIDVFKWKVYGLGLRGAMKGVIYPQMEWIEEFPDMDYIYANDFGFSVDPNALIKYTEDAKNIYFKLLAYQPIDNVPELVATFEAFGVEKEKQIACDSSDKYSNHKGTVEMVSGLVENGYGEAFKVRKTKDIMFWIGSCKTKKLHCVKDEAGLWRKVKKERENYIFKEINGKSINQPIDGHDHALTAMRYGHMSFSEESYSLTW